MKSSPSTQLARWNSAWSKIVEMASTSGPRQVNATLTGTRA